jgi:hypothetical protein
MLDAALAKMAVTMVKKVVETEVDGELHNGKHIYIKRGMHQAVSVLTSSSRKQ